MLFVGQAVGFAFAAFANSFLTHKLGLVSFPSFLDTPVNITQRPRLGQGHRSRRRHPGLRLHALDTGFPVPRLPRHLRHLWLRHGLAGRSGKCLHRHAAWRGDKARLSSRIVRSLSRQHVVNQSDVATSRYGLGAAVVPLAATAFASSGILFSRFYGISLGLAAINAALLVYAFRLNYIVDVNEPTETLEAPGVPPVTVVEGQEVIELADQSRRDSTAATSVLEKSEEPSELEAGRVEVRELDTRLQKRSKKGFKRGVMWQALTNRATLLTAIFILF